MGSTPVRIVAGNLDGLCSLEADALVLLFFSPVSQPQCVAGYADWLLGGRIGRLLFHRRFEARVQEDLRIPSQGLLAAEQLFLLGLGSPELLSQDRVRTLMEGQIAQLGDAGVRTVSIGPPALPKGHKGPLWANNSKNEIVTPELRFLLEWLHAAKRGGFESIALLDPDGTVARLGGELRKMASLPEAGIAFEES